jgi:long-chain fatty acid transport protein
MRSLPGKKRFVQVGAALLLLTISHRARAGGLTLYEIGTPDLGLASAGYAARAQDAATVLTNPAGMTRLDRSQFLLSGQALYGAVQFTRGKDTSPSLGTNDGGNCIGWLPGGSAFFVWSATPDLKVGLGLFSNFGLALSYDDGWAGRYYAQSATLVGLSVMPSVAYRLLPSLSVGVSANILYGVLKDRVAVNGVLPSRPDGTLEVSSDDWGIGAEIGVLLEPREGTRVGVTYSSPISLDFVATPTLTDVAPPLLGFQKPLTLHVKVPQGIMASVYQEVVPGVAVLANIGWQNWSQFGKIDVQIANEAQTSATVDLSYSDTWHAALGSQIQIVDGWRLSAGIAYDTSMVSPQHRTATLPLGEVWRFGAGVQHPVSGSVELGAAYELGWGGSPSVDQDRGPLAGHLAGTYENELLHFFALNVSWKL